jgi:hypothetical protein
MSRTVATGGYRFSADVRCQTLVALSRSKTHDVITGFAQHGNYRPLRPKTPAWLSQNWLSWRHLHTHRVSNRRCERVRIRR